MPGPQDWGGITPGVIGNTEDSWTFENVSERCGGQRVDQEGQGIDH